MEEQRIPNFAIIALFVAMASLGSFPASAQSKVLDAIFTPSPIKVDGNREGAWDKAPASDIAICMNGALKVQLNSCMVSGTVQALWNGPLLYLLFTVNDQAISTASSEEAKRSGVQFYVDQYDDRVSQV